MDPAPDGSGVMSNAGDNRHVLPGAMSAWLR